MNFNFPEVISTKLISNEPAKKSREINSSPKGPSFLARARKAQNLGLGPNFGPGPSISIIDSTKKKSRANMWSLFQYLWPATKCEVMILDALDSPMCQLSNALRIKFISHFVENISSIEVMVISEISTFFELKTNL